MPLEQNDLQPAEIPGDGLVIPTVPHVPWSRCVRVTAAILFGTLGWSMLAVLVLVGLRGDLGRAAVVAGMTAVAILIDSVVIGSLFRAVAPFCGTRARRLVVGPLFGVAAAAVILQVPELVFGGGLEIRAFVVTPVAFICGSLTVAFLGYRAVALAYDATAPKPAGSIWTRRLSM